MMKAFGEQLLRLMPASAFSQKFVDAVGDGLPVVREALASHSHSARCSRCKVGLDASLLRALVQQNLLQGHRAKIVWLVIKFERLQHIHKYKYICCVYINIYTTALPAPPPLQWSWVGQVPPPPRGCGPVVGLWWFRVGLELV